MSLPADRAAQGEALSHAVWAVLARQGLEKLTVRAVAAAAGCTTGLVMHRFPNRRALLLHARQLLHDTTRQRVEALEAAATSPRAALRAVLRQGMAIDPETTNWSIVWLGFLAAAVADAELIGMHRRNNRAWRQRVERLVAEAAPDDIGVSVSYPLPGTKFYEEVKAQLGRKTHWRDSNDLAMMFRGAYDSDFYRSMRDLLHQQVNLRQARDTLSPVERSEAHALLESRWKHLFANESEHRSEQPTPSPFMAMQTIALPLL